MSERITEAELKRLESGWGEGYHAERLIAEVRRLRGLLVSVLPDFDNFAYDCQECAVAKEAHVIE